MNLEGKMLGNRYEIIEKIGNGGMATVYKAKCHVLNRYVAVKVLRDEFTTDEEFIKRFAAEAQAAASLTHPNIVSIYDVGNEGSLYYIVMELIKGKTLKEIIDEEGALSWKWAVNIAIQIASALEMAHKNHIVHRDIKPHNIIITEDGMAKVTDFGIAKAVSNSTITAFGTTIGSVHYFSPEHARGGFTDAKSDLYSLGVVMYEMLTGRVPFDADTPVSIALKHMQEEAVAPILINPAIPEAVNNIILKAMKKDVNLRYSSATEMLQDLNLALKNPDGDFVTMRGNGNDYPTQKIPIYDSVVSEKARETRSDTSNKKQGKFKSFIQKHKKLSYLIGAILLFVLAFGGTALVTNLTTPKDVQIPNLVGLTKEEAEQKGKELKLNITISSEEYDDTVEAGKVISQDPSFIDNYTVKQKSEIKIVISKGKEIVNMPKLVGLSKEEAIKALEELNLEADITEETSKKVEEGYVISQDPSANTQVSAGTSVKVVVSKGTGITMVTVPGVIGKQEQEAKNTLTSAGLQVTVNYTEDTSKENGVVLSQSIDSGKSVEQNSSISITVNKKAETKNATVVINVKSITGGYDTSDNTISSSEKTVNLELRVNGEVVRSEPVDKNSTNVSISIKGKGEVSLKLNLGNGTWVRTDSINLNDQSSYTFK